MTILDKIIENKRVEVEHRKSVYPVKVLEKGGHFNSTGHSLKQAILSPNKSGIIAEFKRRFPSKKLINADAPVARTTMGYIDAGAAALSILTDKHFFGGTTEDLMQARSCNICPILRKDFIIDEYQVLETKAIGADAVLLIAAILTPQQVRTYSVLARSIGLEVLVEIHTAEELFALDLRSVQLVGVNNRNLTNFEVDIETSKRLSHLIDGGIVKISESGIDEPERIIELRKFDYQGFLIGQRFMKRTYPENACRSFIKELRRQESKSLML